MIRCINLLSLVLLLALANGALAEIAVPSLKSHVTDLTETLSSMEISRLEQQLTDFEAKKGSQIALLIIPTTQPETIEQYSIRVAEVWKLGRKGIDDGVLLLVAKNDRTLRIETGYGLEGVLPDALARRIIDEIIVPKFRQGHFFGGLQAGVEQIISIIEGETLPESEPAGGASLAVENIIPFLFIALVLGRTLQSMFGRMAGATITGSIAGALTWLISSSIAVALLIAIAIFVISLFEQTGRIIHRGGPGYRNWPGGGFSGGGFRGGGGGFGGGGASGRW
ncbi:MULTISPECIES: TPM domain-containing protein [Nitrosomonas]|uniref:TPM domain-containing protein n=1 Tax=Nitrosomonas TaxID=914 RepID=UPI0019366866|nr:MULTISPECIES: YgcG family protein [Nitrosomonas]MEB2331224.1 YgcG family protein [Nitrosomonas sp.]QOJ08862.1 MAG: YgcG family protein [Nitrosomonas sp. H1_AOB3]